MVTFNNLGADCAAGYTAFRRSAKFEGAPSMPRGWIRPRSLMATSPTVYGNTRKFATNFFRAKEGNIQLAQLNTEARVLYDENTPLYRRALRGAGHEQST